MQYTKNKTKALVAKLKRELSYLGREYKELIKSPEKREMNTSELLMCDNFYLIEQTAKNAVQGIGQIKEYGRDIGFEYPRIYCHLSDFTDEISIEGFTGDALADFLEKKQVSDPYLSTELYALDSMLAGALVSKIYECIKTAKQDEKRTERFVKLLFARKNIDFFEVFSRVSLLEKILLRDPSGVYGECDKTTKAAYRESVIREAKKQNTSEFEYALQILNIAKEEKGEARSLGYYLVREKKDPLSNFYFPTVAVITFALLSLYFLFVGHDRAVYFVAALFLLLPFFDLSKQIVSAIMSKLSPQKVLPRLELDKIGDDMRTLTVVTTLLFGEKSDAAIFDRLEDFCNLSPAENVYFGVLGDLCDAAEPVSAADDEIIDYAVRRVEALNKKYGDRFFLFVRDRGYSISEKKYMGWERKRGAIIELVRLIKGKETSISTVIGDKAALTDTKYVITLDSDTRLSHTSIKRLVGTAAHPQNRPEIEKRGGVPVVTKGYGIMQPRMICSLESASRSYFSLMQFGSGGIEFYDLCDFNVYQQIFGEGIFCGKGIFDVDAFYEVIDGAFPEECVLSHDMLEGTRLRAAYLGDVSLVDSAPSSSMSYYDRLHRWIRGDVQALAFCKSPVNALGRFKLIDNILRALTPVFALFAILTAALFGKTSAAIIVICALLYLIYPALLSFVLPIVSRNVGAYKVIVRSYFSYAVGGMVKDAANMLYNIASLAYLSFVSLDAIIRAAWRTLFSKKHMLEWTTADESERKKNTLGSYLRRMQISVWAGTALLMLTDELSCDICALMFIAFPFAAYLLSRKLGRPGRSFASQKKQISEYARAMWGFFGELVTAKDNYLPPDNFQILPKEEVAHRTSPTNIGMYLNSALAARDFGFIDSGELERRLNDTLATVEKMEKWNGHLYNWYDTRDLTILSPGYVSTVDSGNFFSSLVALREGILEYAHENTALLDIAKRIDALIAAVKFAPLYNTARKLFYIGYDPSFGKFEENYYDLYMSEARLASYFAIARREVPDEHWRALGRHFIGDGNHIGLASWSGTAFEYFMPALFLPVYPDSMAYEGLMFAFSINKSGAYPTKSDEGRVRYIWGKSESAFYSFDREMNYRYRAIGQRKLGLVRGLEADRVFSAYSLFLMMKASVRDALAGLASMKDVGAYGKYGFYEAIDLTPSRVGGGRAVVKSYMAHHMGMSMISCANAAFDDVFCRRFMRAPLMRASSLLLSEKLPADAIIYKKEVRELDEKSLQIIDRIRNRQSAKARAEEAHDALRAEAVSDGRMRVCATSAGFVSLFFGERSITPPSPESLLPFSLLFECDGKVYRVLGAPPEKDKIENFDFTSSKGSVCYDISYRSPEKIRARTTVCVDPDRHMAIFGFNAEGKFRTISPGVIFEPMLCRDSDFRSHPSFSKLFVEAQCLKDEKILLYRRKKRADNEKEIWLGVAFAELGAECGFGTKAERLLPELCESDDIETVFSGEHDTLAEEYLHVCVDPICFLKRRSSANGKYKCEILVAAGESRESVILDINEARRIKGRNGIAAKKCALYSQTKQRLASADENALCASSYILASLIHKNKHEVKRENLLALPQGKSALWRHGISGDEKIVFIDAAGGISTEALQMLLASHKLLWLSGVKFELVILYHGGDEYTNPKKSELERQILRFGSDEFVGKRAGIFLLADRSVNRAEYELFECIASISATLSASMGCELTLSALKITGDESQRKKLIRRHRAPRRPLPPPEDAVYGVYGGEFCKNGFFADKSVRHGVWSYVYCNGVFGTLLTQNSLGFTWYKNSGEMRLSKWSPDRISYSCGEHVCLEYEGNSYDLAALSDSVCFRRSCAEYKGILFGVRYTLSVGCDRLLAAKPIHLKFDADLPYGARLIYTFEPVLSNMKKYENVIDAAASDDGIFVRSLFGDDEWGAFLFGSDEAKYEVRGEECSVIYDDPKEKEFFFLLGARPLFSDKSEKFIRRKFVFADDALSSYKEYEKGTSELFAPIAFKSEELAYELMANYYLPYQAYYVRMLAKTGFYQSSGAYGFRDQLQDSLAALYFRPEITARQIIRCAAHQYEEGDVQHWWHPNVCGGRFGIRSRYSDDPLWLAFSVCEYLDHTGDASILDIAVYYLHSRPLGAHENERCETAVRSGGKDSVYAHCIRAIERSLKFGAHGLPLFRGGDWNDGMNAVGRREKGESVWLGWFLLGILERFIPVCRSRGDDEHAEKYERIRGELICSQRKHAWDGKWYLRGFYDDGTPLGSYDSAECRIDMMAQSFAAFVAQTDKEDVHRLQSALYSVYDRLFDKKYGILRLFEPPFDSCPEEPGYIKSYPAGIRENGGQYSHGAVWYVMAMYAAGDEKRGKELLDAMNPILKCSDASLAKIYGNEPYAMSGDIYTAAGEYGRGGWSQYTGSAAWYFRAILECLAKSSEKGSENQKNNGRVIER